MIAEDDVGGIAVPQPDDRLGEAREVVGQAGQLGEAGLDAPSRTRLPRYRCPRVLDVAPEIRLDVQDDLLSGKAPARWKKSFRSL